MDPSPVCSALWPVAVSLHGDKTHFGDPNARGPFLIDGFFMAGTNRILKKDQIIFRAGDKSDGMYLVRRGELCVYLENNGKEVLLAKVGEGGMIGEMSLFDLQPRSASVRATQDSEVTLISTDDFTKLTKQIPKWFVSLMTALSTRLRQTNERLKNLEGPSARLRPATSSPTSAQAQDDAPGIRNAKNPTLKPMGLKPFQSALRMINILSLLWNKDAEKEGRDWFLGRMVVEKQLTDIFSEDPTHVRTLLEVLIQEKFVGTRLDTYKNCALVLQNKSLLSNLSNFMIDFIKRSPEQPFLTKESLNILRCLEKIVAESHYDTVTVSLADLEKQAIKSELSCETWRHEIQIFSRTGDDVRLVKTSSGVGLKASKKTCSAALKMHEVLASMAQSGLF